MSDSLETSIKTWFLQRQGVALMTGGSVQSRYALLPSPPQDCPSKKYLLDGPPPGMPVDTFKKMQALNQVLLLRSAEAKLAVQGAVTNRQARWEAEAMRRLPM